MLKQSLPKIVLNDEQKKVERNVIFIFKRV